MMAGWASTTTDVVIFMPIMCCPTPGGRAGQKLSLQTDGSQLKIDVHHHVFAPSIMQNKVQSNKAVGFKTPAENLPWSLAKSLAMMENMGIGAAVLSYPAGVPEKGSRSDVRIMNTYVKELCDSAESQGRFGWFACLPDLRDAEGAILEIEHALDVLRADGISLSSSYGQGQDAVYLGDNSFEAIWQELDRRGAVVFVHGTQTPSSTPYPHEYLGLPITEVPNETFKAAAHLVVSGMKRRYSRTKIILAHFGGTTAMLMPRVAGLSSYMGCTLTPEQIMEDLCSFYFESALSAHESTIRLVEGLVSRARLLYGTDYPAVATSVIDWNTRNLESYYGEDREGFTHVTQGTALQLFPRFLALAAQQLI